MTDPAPPPDDDTTEWPPAPVRGTSPVVVGRSLDDTDAGWGEQPVDDDERLLRDVPPHWG